LAIAGCRTLQAGAVQMILSGFAPDITEFWLKKACLLQRNPSLQHSIAIFNV
jgi:hypothetical protein